jgi:hypothetical protein
MHPSFGVSILLTVRKRMFSNIASATKNLVNFHKCKTNCGDADIHRVVKTIYPGNTIHIDMNVARNCCQLFESTEKSELVQWRKSNEIFQFNFRKKEKND